MSGLVRILIMATMVMSILVPNGTPFQISHQALDCFHGIDFAYQGRHPPSQFATKQLEPIHSMTLNLGL